MILQIAATDFGQPRISLNQLGEFPFATQKKKVAILRNQKYPQGFCAPYYDPALHGMLRSFQVGFFQEHLLRDEAEIIAQLESEKPYQIAKRDNNVAAIRNLIVIGDDAQPPDGAHTIIRQNAKLFIDGVVVSARPEILTENTRAGYIALTKLRLSKSKVSADAQEIVLLVLLNYGRRLEHDGMVFNIEQSKLIDCFSKTVIAGHSIGRHRYQQLHQALQEIAALWPEI